MPFAAGVQLKLKVWSRISLLIFWVVNILRTSRMLQVKVTLLNGNPELLALPLTSTVQDVRTKAKQVFGKKYLKLITAKNRVLADFEQTLEEAEIEDRECLTALVLQPQLAATRHAFALWCHGDSTIATWGNAAFGADSSAVQDQLKDVVQIQATYRAFAAILEDGSIVTWGDANCGGDSSAVQDQLQNVQQIQATSMAFAAILEDGSVVTWGYANCGGDSSAVRDKLRGVQQIQAAFGAFAAILEDGSVVTSSVPSLLFWKMDPSLLGVMNALAVTVRQFEISSRVCSRTMPQKGHLLRFWQMDPSLPGVRKNGVVTFPQFKISWGVYSKFKPQLLPLLRFWKMDPSLPGVIKTVAVTVPQFNMHSGLFSPVVMAKWQVLSFLDVLGEKW